MNKEVELRYALLKEVHQYYPVGIPHLNSRYPGYQALCQIIENIHKELADTNRIEPWFTVLEQFKSIFNDKSVFDVSSLQFPSLTLWVILGSHKDDFSERTTRLTVSLSLLSPYYTVFFEEDIKPIGLFNRNYGPPARVNFYKNCSSETEKNYFQNACTLAQQYYPEHIFIDHRILFTTVVTGVIPHGEDIEGAKSTYTAYDLLFQYAGGSSEFKLLHYAV